MPRSHMYDRLAPPLPVSCVQHELALPGPTWNGPGARGRDVGRSPQLSSRGSRCYLCLLYLLVSCVCSSAVCVLHCPVCSSVLSLGLPLRSVCSSFSLCSALCRVYYCALCTHFAMYPSSSACSIVHCGFLYGSCTPPCSVYSCCSVCSSVRCVLLCGVCTPLCNVRSRTQCSTPVQSVSYSALSLPVHSLF